jgi:hypothetical protein
MSRSAGALALGVMLSLVEPGAAADPYGAPASPYRAYPAPPHPLLLPPCHDSFWSVLLQCAPRAEVAVPYDDLVVQNQIRGLRPTPRKPYIQVFSW